MKLGLKETLMTVAVATLGFQAMAMAPVIGNIPSPVVGNEQAASGPSQFVFPDALNLDTYVTDDNKQPGEIRWSYEIGADPWYAINGVGQLTGSDNPVTPGAKAIDNQVLQSEQNTDGNTRTATVRNTKLTPFSGTGAAPSAQGIIDSQPVTLYASDGTTYSSKQVMFYSDNGGADRMAGQFTPVYSANFNGSTNSWYWGAQLVIPDLLDPLVSGTNGGTALCIGTSMAKGGFGGWASPYGTIPLVDNNVYRIRAKMNRSQVEGDCPLWDLVIGNYAQENGVDKGMNLFGADFMFFDNEGHANAVTATAADFTVYWTPSPVRNAEWKTNAFAAANQGKVDGFIEFRVLDYDGNGALTAQNDGGTICMDELTVERMDLDQLTASKTQLYAKNSFTQNVDAVNIAYVDPATSFNYAGGVITLTPGNSTPPEGSPNNTGRTWEYAQLFPGNSDVGSAAEMLDNYPVVWEPNSLYEIQVTMSAPDQNSQDNPMDAFWIGMDTPTNELITESYVSSAANMIAMPNTGAAQTYTVFFQSGNGSVTGIENGKRLRWRMSFANHWAYSWGNNSGSISVHSVAINKVNLAE